MRSVRAVVVPASLHNTASSCVSCGKPWAQNWIAQHICTECGYPQPTRNDEDYFSVFGVGRQFKQDLSLLERRYYELSRLLHPDRFTTASSDAKIISVQRMSLVNQAYQTLKKPQLLRAYLLKLEGVEAKPSIPADVAEKWFEVQEALFESSDESMGKLREFELELTLLKEKVQVQVFHLEERFDQVTSQESSQMPKGEPQNVEKDSHVAKNILVEISQEIQKLNYLNSIEKDVERMKKNAYSN